MSEQRAIVNRLTALSLLSAPLVAALIAFGFWAVGQWAETGRRVAEADQRLRLAQARATQLAEYEILAEAWTAHVEAPGSGLASNIDDAEGAATAMTEQLRLALASAAGSLDSVTALSAAGSVGAPKAYLQATGALPAVNLPIFLDALRRGSPHLFLETFDARADAAGALAVRLRVRAYGVTPELVAAAAPTADAAPEDGWARIEGARP